VGAKTSSNGPDRPGRISNWTGQIWEGDCLELMARMPAHKVDLIVADLPYGTSRNRWDSPIDLMQLWDRYRHVLKPGGTVLLTATQPFTSRLVISNPDWFRYEWIWEKTIGSGQLNIKRQPLRVHESILVFSPEPVPYRPQMEEGKPYTVRRNVSSWDGRGYNAQRAHTAENAGVRWPRTVLRVPNPRIKGGHPTQKPVALFEYLIRSHSDKGAVVLDNVIGSGTTAEACHNSGRKWIGMDSDPKYITMARARMGLS